jgi:para-aminobenzoate synthetase/4-amino-4-deoxychorismate lyase
MLSRNRLDSSLEPTQMLRVFRGTDGLFGLIGAWHDSRAVIGFAPTRRLTRGGDPFAVLGDPVVCAGAEGFGGGWVGALGYQLGGRLETLPPPPHRPLSLADASLAYYDHVLVRDDHGWWFEALEDDDNRDRLEAQRAMVECMVRRARERAEPYTCTAFLVTPAAAGHRAAVASALRHLVAGDIFQANVCRRFEAAFSGDPLDIFCAGVEKLAPSYGAYLTTPDGAIASLSPELFLRRTGRRVLTSPIKGTAPLDVDVESLVGSVKDRAENVMIVDLMRNDLGRVCVPGSVHVEAIARAEQRAGVWHLVSDVVGTLSPGEDDESLLRATFPPGSVTGAPKVKAMEIIHEVETTGREAYTGAIGYASPAAGLELNVAIRTFELSAGRLWFGVGGGVVIDSTPEGERVETLVKAAPLVAAIGARLSSAEEHLDFGTSGRPQPLSSPVPIPAEAPGVDLSQGVFTTLLVMDGVPVDLDSHLARLGGSLEDCFAASLPADLVDRITARVSGLPGRHRLRISVRPTRQGLGEPVLTTSPSSVASPAALRLVPVVVPGGLGAHKLGDRSRLSAVEPSHAAWSANCDALVTDSDGSVLETGRGNLFIVTDDAVHTPALDGRLLPGVTRQLAIRELAAAGIPVIQRRLMPDDVAAATEVFVTSSLDRVRPVVSVDGVGVWDEGRTTTWLTRRLRASARTGHGSRPASTGPTLRRVRLLLIDNYDSFVYNLDQYTRELGAHTHVVRNDAVAVDEIASAVESGDLQGVVISPGPGRPADAGVSTELVERLGEAVPILGVCLGHQCIAAAYGGRIVPAGTVVHGKASLVHHDGRGVFDGLAGPLVAGRYHSLVVSEEGLPSELVVTARTGSGVVMGLRHREHPVEGVQFHPESILSCSGHRLLTNFLYACSCEPKALSSSRPTPGPASRA